jgi:ribonuclease P protein component
MKKINIVKESKDFEKAIKNGILFKNKFYILYILDNNHPYYRFGISVTKKTGNAVLRNFIKRRVKMIVDSNKEKYIKGKDYVIIMRNVSKDATYEELNNSFVSLINSVNSKLNK